MDRVWAQVVKYFEWLDHNRQNEMDTATSGQWGYWKTDKCIEREKRYGWG